MQYWDWLKGVLVGKDVATGAGIDHCPAPCLGYSFRTSQPVLPEILLRLPVTLSLAAGAAIIWLIMGISVGVISALKRGSFFDRAAMTLALAGVSLPIFWTGLVSLALFSYKLGWTPPGASYVPLTENPAVGACPDPAVDHAGPAVLGAVRPTHPRRHARDHERGLHPHRAGEGPDRADGGGQARPALGADPPRDDLRSRLRSADRRCGAHRDVFGLPGLGQLAIKSTLSNDLPPVLAVVLITAVFVAVCNLIVDLLYAVLDPRVRTR